MNDIVKRYEVEGYDFIVKGESKSIKFFQLKHAKKPNVKDPSLDSFQSNFVSQYDVSELEERIKANKCEVCEKEGGYFEVHHIRKLKDIEKGTAWWKKMMIARSRKTLVLCTECHHKLHNGTLPDMRYKYVG